MKNKNNLLDKHIGTKIREKRRSLGVTGKQLGAVVGVTYQQIQKYEAGIDRISASALYNIAKYFNVNLSWFMRGYND